MLNHGNAKSSSSACSYLDAMVVLVPHVRTQISKYVNTSSKVTPNIFQTSSLWSISIHKFLHHFSWVNSLKWHRSWCPWSWWLPQAVEKLRTFHLPNIRISIYLSIYIYSNLKKYIYNIHIYIYYIFLTQLQHPPIVHAPTPNRNQPESVASLGTPLGLCNWALPRRFLSSSFCKKLAATSEPSCPSLGGHARW